MKMRAFALTCCVSLAITPLANGAQSAPTSLALTGGTVIDVRTGASMADATVLIRDDRIVQIGHGDDVRIPPGAQVVSVNGRWIVPGFIDMHVHVATVEGAPLELYVANGVTAIRDLGGNITVLRLMREAAATANDRPKPRLFFAGAMLDGKPPSAPRMSIMVDTPERAASAVNLLVDQTADAIKVYNGITEPVLEAIAAAARARHVPVVGHIPRALTARRAVDLGMSGIEHSIIRSRDLQEWSILTPAEFARIQTLSSVTERDALVWSHLDLTAGPLRALLADLAKKAVFFDPTLSIDEYDTLFLYPAEAEHPNNRYLKRSFVAANLGPEHEAFRLPEAMRAAAAAGLAKRREFVGMCYRAGITLVAGTDGPGIGRLAPGFGLQHELQLLVEAGLTPLSALRAATIDAARALHREHALGTIEAGKFADLVILGANPVEDIKNASNIAGVVVKGKFFARPALDQLLRQLEAEARAAT